MAEQATQHYRTRAAEVARRLRLAQYDLADEDDGVREEYLSRELSHAVSDLTPTERPVFLAELLDLFPDIAPAGAAPPAAPAPPPAEAPPGKQLESLLESYSDLDQTERDRLLQALLDSEMGQELAGRLIVDTVVEEDRGRDESPTLTAILVEFLATMESFLVGTLSQVAPGRGGIERGDLAALVRRCRDGDPDAPEELKRQLFMLRSHTAALLAAIPQATRMFAKQHVGEFTPEAIMELVRLEGKPFMSSWEVAYWTKYSELASRRISEDTIEKSMLDNIADCVERLLRSRA